MSRLPPNEWLHLAKRLAVGRKSRVRHNEERDTAMDVYNNGDSWTAYCHRCHMSGWVPKQHQELNTVRVDEARVQSVPADCFHISQATPYERKRIWELLVLKGCPPGIIPEEYIWFSRSANRILLRQGLRALGRALSAQQQPKWLMFGEWWNQPRIWMTRYRDAGPMVLVEDALSSYKVAKAIEHYAPESSLSVAAVLGTVLTSASLPLVAGRDVLCMFDGDKPGALGSIELRKRLSVFGGRFQDIRPDVGDPKDMELEAVWQRLRNGFG
ncbi:topoisomerase-primase domain protein [Pectobacterium phage PPWS2]|uniref:Topoisomerase-primase domain protein n=1 Tax=Pectobacterium phage PPWS2 TaxID=2153295 RepID=A0A3G9E9P8_9CAUD|nr:DNA primase [Pectobacterium phage PPWS2]BBD74650.1 topoisomerase-primase domain protein [Pectobacterium phage PPWS2]